MIKAITTKVHSILFLISNYVREEFYEKRFDISLLQKFQTFAISFNFKEKIFSINFDFNFIL